MRPSAPMPWLGLVFPTCITVAGLLVCSVLAFVPIRLAQLVGQCQQDAVTLHHLGLSVGVCAGYLFGSSMLTFVGFVLVATLLFWRKPGEWVANYSALALVAVGVVFTSFHALVMVPPAWSLPVTIIRALGAAIPLIFGYIFPDGRFVPRWSRLLAVAVIGLTLLWIWFPEQSIQPWDTRNWPSGLFVAAGFIALSVLTQIYRYLTVASPLQRQQIKWILAAYALVAPMLLVLFLPVSLAPALRQPGLPRLTYTLLREPVFDLTLSLIVVSIAFSILRYRLWEIDLLIRRTLLYSMLTAALALFYFGSVFVLQRLVSGWSGEPRSPLVTVFSTLGVVILFSPLRGRLQGVLDRRFYRRRYNAERVLASFNAFVRDEMMLDALSARLVAVVDQMWQPTEVSLWLSQPVITPAAPPAEHTPVSVPEEQSARSPAKPEQPPLQ